MYLAILILLSVNRVGYMTSLRGYICHPCAMHNCQFLIGKLKIVYFQMRSYHKIQLILRFNLLQMSVLVNIRRTEAVEA